MSEWNFLVYIFFVFDTTFCIVLRVREIAGTVGNMHVSNNYHVIIYIHYLTILFSYAVAIDFTHFVNCLQVQYKVILCLYKGDQTILVWHETY